MPRVINEIKKTLKYFFGSKIIINDQKTTLSSKAHNRHVTGITLTNDNKISIGRSRKRYISALIHKFKLSKLNHTDIHHLKGLLSYASYIEPSFIRRMEKKYGKATLELIKNIQKVRKMNDDKELKFISKFKKGNHTDFSISYQLHKMYSEGVGLDEDHEKAEIYKNKFVAQLKSYEFRVDSVKLINYKGFTEIEVPFNTNGSTILVGNNGSGKSSILDALQKTLSHISSRLTTRSYNGDAIDELEINSNADFSSIITTFSISGLLFTSELSISRPLSSIKKKSRFSDLNELGNIFRLANSVDPSFPLPLIASYNVERANDITTRDIEKSEEILDSYIWNKSRGYSKSLTGKADFRIFKWFKEITESENEKT